ncbi:MAG TPA: transglutaminase family protein, partial [Spirochaetes bacterium]|nr:transglutaminase family protein [Spirochaetota bacterium]
MNYPLGSSMKILVIISILLITPGFLFSDHFFLKGHVALTNAKVNIIHKISIKRPVRNLKVRLYKFYNFTNGMNKQIVSTYEPKITPKPELIETFVDDLGNTGIEIRFKNVQSDILIETSFIFDNEVELYPITRFYGYPLNISSIRHVSQYLKGTTLAPIDSAILKKQVKKLVSRSRNVFQATMKIISWTQNNIELSPDVTYDEGNETFKQAKGNRNGILNLTLAMLRIARIPCRLVHGLSINSSYLFLSKKRPREPKPLGGVGGHILYLPDQSKDNVEIRYPKSLYKWIEVYFPDRDWVPFDPQTSFLFTPSNLLRQNVSLDSGDGLSQGIHLPKRYRVIFQYYVELSKERSQLTVNKHLQGGSGQFLYPSLKSRDMSFVQTLFRTSNKKGHYKHILKDKEIRIEFLPYTLDFTENREQLELKVSPGFYYSQRI